VTSFWSIENSAGKRVTDKRMAGFNNSMLRMRYVNISVS